MFTETERNNAMSAVDRLTKLCVEGHPTAGREARKILAAIELRQRIERDAYRVEAAFERVNQIAATRDNYELSDFIERVYYARGEKS